jgi:hypothetical protein
MVIPELGLNEWNAHGPCIVVVVVARNACRKVVRIGTTTNPRRCLQDRDIRKTYELQHYSCREPRCTGANNANGLTVVSGDLVMT